MTYWDTGGFEFTVYRKNDRRLIPNGSRTSSGKKDLDRVEWLVSGLLLYSLINIPKWLSKLQKQSPSAKIMRAHPDITVRLYGKMFLTEIQCMQKLNGQSNICHLFNFGFENQTCYMAIELADSDLETMIIDKQKFDKYEVGFFKLLYNLTYICY
uniref:Transposase n=1 Tax=Ditylenchus dipsaci TaxID=166011 RepID=A0A915CYG3_9BILA